MFSVLFQGICSSHAWHSAQTNTDYGLCAPQGSKNHSLRWALDKAGPSPLRVTLVVGQLATSEHRPASYCSAKGCCLVGLPTPGRGPTSHHGQHALRVLRAVPAAEAGAPSRAAPRHSAPRLQHWSGPQALPSRGARGVCSATPPASRGGGC